MTIYKAYDIRGVYPTEIDEKKAYRIARGFCRYLKAGRVVIGRDMRASTPSLHAATVDGLLDEGADVIDVGLITTPMSYFATATLGTDGGLMVTASHNPAQYNGFKLCGRGAAPISGDEGIPAIRAIAEGPELPKAPKRGAVSRHDVTEAYGTHVRSFASPGRKLKVAIDAANGMAGAFADRLLAGLPVEIVPLYFELDGRFPNHEANPLKASNLKALQAAVVRERCDLGAAFDGDADRCTFIDEKGGRVQTDLLTALLARQFLAKRKGPVVYDLRSSWAVPEEIARAGGTPVRGRVGHSLLKQLMREHDAVFGGELSGHYYFRENHFCDSAFITLVCTMNLLWQDPRPISEQIRPIARYASTGEVNFKVDDADRKIRELARTFADGKIDHLDGITVEYPDVWFNVRKSNTEPALRLNVEGRTAIERDQMFKRLEGILGQPEEH